MVAESHCGKSLGKGDRFEKNRRVLYFEFISCANIIPSDGCVCPLRSAGQRSASVYGRLDLVFPACVYAGHNPFGIFSEADQFRQTV